MYSHTHARAHFAINIHNEMCIAYNRNFYYYSKKKRKYLYQKKVEVNNKLMLRSWERRRERVKSNEAAISRFSSQDSKPLKRRGEQKS